MRTHFVSFIAVVALLTTSTLSGQDRTPLEATVKMVNDRRSTGYFSGLTVNLELPDISAAELSAVRMVVENAVDDTGKKLFEAPDEDPDFVAVYGAGKGADDPSRRARVDVKLLNPAREATRLKELSGTIDLYMPGRDPNATVSVPDILSKAGKSVASKSLKGSGVSITVIDPKQREAEKAKAVEAHARELKEQGYDDEDMEWMMEDFADGYFVPDEMSLALQVDDPDGRIQELELVDAAGEKINAYPRYMDDLTVFSAFEPLTGKIALRVSLRTAKTISRHSFRVENVPLP